MRTDSRLTLALAGLAPLFMASDSLYAGMMAGGAFLTAHVLASGFSLLSHPELKRGQVFMIAMLGAAAGVGLFASVARVLDPLLFELLRHRVYAAPFLAPVVAAAHVPFGQPERERGWENIVLGLALSVSLAVFGAVREFLATATAPGSNHDGMSAFIPMAIQPAGAFILLGMITAAVQALGRIKRRVGS
ncbi:MAG: hypothetical protein JW923_01685 [Spirochaetales bacterium]|nr:hypothetical protein [Spirochaetales bacterium]